MTKRSFTLTFEGYWREEDKDEIPSRSGVYCVYTCTKHAPGKIEIHELIYIGEGGNVRERISNRPASEWESWKSYLKWGDELCFSFAQVDAATRERIQCALIFGHQPPENDKCKEGFPFDTVGLNLEGRTELLTTSFIVERTS